ncbi:MAG: N-acetyltransferase [Acidobacteriia bacterium]|nr:N-acetyltransferase [Terriglobia bacterium]
MTAYIHPSALIETGVEIGDDTSIWDHVHIRHDTHIGHHSIVGEKTHISYHVRIGDLVKINAFVYVCTAVTLEDGVMVSAGCVFTNDRFPRAADPELAALRSSDPDEETLSTVVRAGATIGAGSIVGCGLTIGRFAMVGMGSLITRSVEDFHLVMGSPARSVGYVCRCGRPFARFAPRLYPEEVAHFCDACRRRYVVKKGAVREFLVAGT